MSKYFPEPYERPGGNAIYLIMQWKLIWKEQQALIHYADLKNRFG